MGTWSSPSKPPLKAPRSIPLRRFASCRACSRHLTSITSTNPIQTRRHEMLQVKLTRRAFIKSNAVAAAAATAGIAVPGRAEAQQKGKDDGVRWDKGVCRYCGTGCGVLVGVKEGRVVATQGDPDAPVNRGLNCIKGYFLSKIMYGKDRLTQPLLRMKNGQYDKNGDFTPISWDKAFDIMAEPCTAALKEGGPRNICMYGSGQWTVWEGYAAAKLMKAGFRTNNLD